MTASLIVKWTLIVGLVISGGWYYLSPSRLNGRNQQKVDRTIKVKRQDLIQRITIAGNVVPERRTIVAAPFNGYVKKLFVKIGDQVKKNDPLVSIVQSLQSTDPVYPLRSPFAGTVVQVSKDEGEYVRKDNENDYVLRVDSLKNLYVISNVPEIDRAKIKPGLEAVIKASAILDKKYKGIVEQVSLASKSQGNWRNSSKVEFPTKIKIINFDEDLKPGMSAILDIITHKKKNTLVLPHEYLIKENGKSYVLSTDGHRIEITTGLKNESFFEILSGIDEGQKVQLVNFLELLTGKQ